MRLVMMLALILFPTQLITAEQDTTESWKSLLRSIEIGCPLKTLLESHPEAGPHPIDADEGNDLSRPNQELQERRSDFPFEGCEFLGMYSVRNGVVTQILCIFIGVPEKIRTNTKAFAAASRAVFGDEYSLHASKQKQPGVTAVIPAVRWEDEQRVAMITIPAAPADDTKTRGVGFSFILCVPGLEPRDFLYSGDAKQNASVERQLTELGFHLPAEETASPGFKSDETTVGIP